MTNENVGSGSNVARLGLHFINFQRRTLTDIQVNENKNVYESMPFGGFFMCFLESRRNYHRATRNIPGLASGGEEAS